MVDAIDHLLEAVGHHLVYRAAFQAQVYHLIRTLPVVLAVLQTDEVVQVHQKLRRSAGARQHRRYDEHHIDEPAAERLQVLRRRGVAADGNGTTDEPGVHGDGGAVVSQVRLVVLVDEMLVQQRDVLVCQFASVHLLDLLGQQASVQTDEALLGQLADKRCDVLVLHIGIGVVLTTLGGIRGLAVVHQELQASLCLAIFAMPIAVEHIGFCHLVIPLRHQGHLYLVLHLLYADAVMNPQVRQNRAQYLLGRKRISCYE